MCFKIDIKIIRRGAIFALLCLFFYTDLSSQKITNLIFNPSFELKDSCPSSLNIDNIYNCQFWFKPTFHGSSDYFNSCSTNTTLSTPLNFVGNQIPLTGNSYGGIITYVNGSSSYNNYREYLEVGLKETLLNGKKYCISFNVSLAENTSCAISNLGFYLSKDSIINRTLPFSSTILLYAPMFEYPNVISDTLNWITIQTTYTSAGNQNFITIGNFKNDLNTLVVNTKSTTSLNIAYYYIDDVSVVEINPANAATNDTLLSRCVNDSVILGTDSTEFATYNWQSTAAGLAALSCTNCPNPVAKPNITTKYYLTKVQCSATTMDSVVVVVLTPTTQANAGLDKNICPNEIVSLGTQDSTAFVNYNWQFNGNSSLSCTNCATPLANVQQSTEFILQRSECGITTSDTVKVNVDLCDILIPNVFTPNADGINDVWKFKLPTGAKLNELTIYDRWGLLMYAINSDQLPLKSETTALNLQWDGYTTAGIACSEGVYFYTLTYTDKKGEEKNLTGFVSLFR